MDVISKLGPMALLEVKSIYVRSNLSSNLNLFIVYGNGWQLAATNLHVFLAVREDETLAIKTEEIRSGDKIWVDWSAFQADGSLTREAYPSSRKQYASPEGHD